VNPVGFVFGVHLHQPVGNFDHVFADHLRDVYRPLVERLAERRFFPFTLHISARCSSGSKRTTRATST